MISYRRGLGLGIYALLGQAGVLRALEGTAAIGAEQGAEAITVNVPADQPASNPPAIDPMPISRQQRRYLARKITQGGNMISYRSNLLPAFTPPPRAPEVVLPKPNRKPRVGRAFTEQDIARIIELSGEGKKAYLIARDLGRHYNSVQRVLDRLRQEGIIE